MNKENLEFLIRNGIIVDELEKSIDCHIYSSEEENPIIARYGFQKPYKSGYVSISRIIGYDTGFRNISSNILQSMDAFFDAKGDGYHSRSIGMLQYTKENIIENLIKSFEREPITVIETGEGNYTILSNGLHRYTLLRILYLSEISKTNENREEIDGKYTIPVKITEIDLEKTYCKYLLINFQLHHAQDVYIQDVCTHYDEKYLPTGNVEIRYTNGTKQIMTKDELIEFTRQCIKKVEDFSFLSLCIQEISNQFQSFKCFINENFFDIFMLDESIENRRSEINDDSRDD